MKNASFLLRIGIAFAFLYPPISAIFDPFSWVGYFPTLVHNLPIDSFIILHMFGIMEVIIVIWILIGKRILIPSVLGITFLLGIIVFNFSQLNILFRDIAIIFMILALLSLNDRVSE